LRQICDFLVIGSGIAGLLYALKASQHGRVILLTKTELEESNSRYAQGGVATVWDESDSFEEHIRDTLVAGAGLCRRETVEHVVTQGPARIRELIELGVSFSRHSTTSDELELAREGGHGKRRILHAKDQTGAEIVRALVAAVRAHPDIDVRPHHVAVDLITERWLNRRRGEAEPFPDRVLGAYALDVKRGEVDVYCARVVAICSGGAGKVYLYTSNPDSATGDGIAMAWRAGLAIHNMEMVQFHPTVLYHPKARTFLISEALRGEGGRLINSSGQPLRRLRGPPRLPGPPRHRRPRHRPRDEAPRRHLRVPGHDPQAGVLPARALPHYFPDLPGLRHRHVARPHPRRARRPLLLRRRARRRGRAHRAGRPLRHRRGGQHRSARGQPPGQQLPAGGDGLRRACSPTPSAPARRRPRSDDPPPDPRLAAGPRRALRRGGGGRAQLERGPHRDVGLRGHRAHQQAPRSAPSAAGAPSRSTKTAGGSSTST
jgi:hypothetical protein